MIAREKDRSARQRELIGGRLAGLVVVHDTGGPPGPDPEAVILGTDVDAADVGVVPVHEDTVDGPPGRVVVLVEGRVAGDRPVGQRAHVERERAGFARESDLAGATDVGEAARGGRRGGPLCQGRQRCQCASTGIAIGNRLVLIVVSLRSGGSGRARVGRLPDAWERCWRARLNDGLRPLTTVCDHAVSTRRCRFDAKRNAPPSWRGVQVSAAGRGPSGGYWRVLTNQSTLSATASSSPGAPLPAKTSKT